ncbi:uncharacterized protein [Nicotiana tomentosiformis]|uniref:uncharacterized protein n=1 Tax=Nicotiana tomentosiformis TaxID=4098 RepID=UPI00388CEBD0
MKGVMWFGKKVKFSPRYIGTFEVLERVGEVACILALPPSLSGVHLVFHVSMLRKYHGNLSQLDEDMSYVVELVAILDQQVQKLRLKNIALMKVHWRGHPVEEATWEIERKMRSRYPHLFETPDSFIKSHPVPKGENVIAGNIG